MANYSISEFVELLDKGELSLNDVLNIRTQMNIPFKIHPLGFYSCTLLDEKNQKIRLHYWDLSINQKKQSSRLVIHDHIFNFKSWIMFGILENIEYSLTEKGDIYNLYATRYKGDISILEGVQEVVNIVEKKSSIYKKGESYLMEAGVLHETRILSDKTFTILHTFDTDLKSARVLSGSHEKKEEIVFNRNNISEKKILDKLNSLF